MKDLINIPTKPLSKEEYRKWIVDIEDALKGMEGSVDRHTGLSQGFKLEQSITPGIYTRKLTMPANTLVVSRIHKQEHPFLIMKGRVSVYDGSEVVTYEAPYNGITKKGTKRILFNHEETTWITFHPITDETIEECDKNGVITFDTFKEYDQAQIGEIEE